MSDVLGIQTVKGNLLDFGFQPKTGLLNISLSAKLALYKEQTQIIGDERQVAIDENGDWQAELIDTDNMLSDSDGAEGEVFYVFEINQRIYKRFVPVSVYDLEFADLPVFGC